MTTVTDDTLDLEIVSFLRAHAEDLAGAPPARAMATQIAGADVAAGRWIALLFARPVARIALVGLLIAAAVGVAATVGSPRSGGIQNGLLVLEPWRAYDPVAGTWSDNVVCGGGCSDAHQIAFSRDGRRHAVVGMDGPTGDQVGGRGASIWWYDDATSRLTMLARCPEAGECSSPSFSVDGRSLAFIEVSNLAAQSVAGQRPRVVAIDLASGARRDAPLTTDLPFFGTSWTADGKVLVSVVPPTRREERRAVVIDLDTGERIEPVTRWPVSRAAVSPDGQTIAYLTYERYVPSDGILRPEDHIYELWLAQADGSNLRRIHHGVPARIAPNNPVWSPDGRQLAFVVNLIGKSGGTFVIDVETGAVNQVLEATPPLMAWLPAS